MIVNRRSYNERRWIRIFDNEWDRLGLKRQRRAKRSLLPGWSSACRVIIADDHPLVPVAVAKSLSSSGDFCIVAIVNSGDALLERLAISAAPCDLIVTDFAMQSDETERVGLDGARLLGLLQRNYPDIPVVVLTMINNGGMLRSMLREGVHGIVSKDEPPNVLAQVCAKVMIGAQVPVLSPKVANRLEPESGGVSVRRGREPVLSQKESEVVRLFAQGYSLTDISHQLSRAITTVATQKRSAMRKLNLNTNADLIRYASEAGMV
ncbi:response regulator transcription factor [Bordetella genomosp. 5]|uniref:response regulator transcription factor n=1 Tax=Bordetella genomosp. 5 TaxID=1395608 RepID=UPI00201694C7|nr:response regulator transcription factor [Bordetella genomosp. 5]